MNLQDKDATINDGSTQSEFELNVLVKEVVGDGETYYVAECVEIPGCVSDGATEEEAKANMEDAMRLCLSVIFEDAMRQVTAGRSIPDMRKVVNQGRLRVHTTPELAYA